ncbi:MAG: hypothetical protein ACK4RK_06850 [Gemmataceae bacterium]
MLDRLVSALIAVCLGALVWLYARSRDQETLDNVPIPVRIQLDPSQLEQYDLEVTGPSQVLASFSGPPSRIRELRSWLQRGEMQVCVTLTVPPDRQQEVRYSDTVRVDASQLHPPPGVQAVVLEDRNRIPVTLRRLVERRLAVRLQYISEDRVGQLHIEPASVLARGPQEILDRTRTLPTQPFVFSHRPEATTTQEATTTTRVRLVQELEGRPIRTVPEMVSVRLTLLPRQKVYELTEIPVQFLCPANFSFQPRWEDERAGRITLRVLGPAAEEPPNVMVFVDLTDGKYEAALYFDEPLKIQLPKEFELAQTPPKSATFRLIPRSAEATGNPVMGRSVDAGLGGVNSP